MESLLPAFEGAVTQGVLWGIMVLGVYITYRILDIADLTVDGSFALGGSVCAVCVANGMNPFLALLLAMFAGVLAGFVTGFLHTVFEIPAILAGILTQIALWSINLHVMGKIQYTAAAHADGKQPAFRGDRHVFVCSLSGDRHYICSCCDHCAVLVFRHGSRCDHPCDGQQ